MAEKIFKKNKFPKIFQMQFNLPEEKVVENTNLTTVLDHFDLHNVTSTAIGTLPSSEDVLVGIIFLFTNNMKDTKPITDCIVWDDHTCTVSIMTLNSTSQTVRYIRLLTFWE